MMCDSRQPLNGADSEPVPPSLSELERWVMDGVAEAVDGCEVEPDGTCEHGRPSWLLQLGLI